MNNLIKPSILITLLITLVSCGGGGGGSSPSVISAPSAPSNLTVTADSASQITLNWDQATGATYYEVYRHTSDDSTAATKINTETVTATNYTDTGLTAGITYYYWIKACHDTGCSDFSSVASATTSKDWTNASHTQTLTASSFIQSAVFSPDGTKIVSGSNDKTIRIWDVSDNYKLLKIIADSSTNTDGHSSTIRSVALSPDGTKIVSGSDDNTIKIWDVSDNYKLLKTINTDGHSNSVMSVAFSPDGTKLVSGSYDRTIKIWDVNDNYKLLKTINTDGHSDTVNSVAFSHDGTKIVSGSDDSTIKIWDVKDSYSLIKTIENVPFNFEKNPNRFYSVAFSPDGSKLVSGSFDKTIKIWDVSDNYKLLKIIAGSSPSNTDGHSSTIRSVALSPDGSKIVSGSADDTVKIWDVDNNYSLVKTFERYDVNTNPSGHKDKVHSVVFNHDGTKIISGSRDSTIKIWE